MAEHAHAHEAHHGDGHSHAHPDSHYVRIWGVLLVLLIVSITGPMLEIPMLTLITAFGIAGVKAFLVMKYFMHLDVEKPMVWYMLTTSVVFLVMFFAAVSPDVMNHKGSRWQNLAAQQTVERLMAAGDTTGHHGEEHGGDHAGAEADHGGGH